eukprot:SAG31_NODE_303_length_18065_cov_5.733107_15_plen_197_part_00
MLGIKHEELHSAHTELFEKMHVWDPATETWVEKPAPKPMRPGLQHLENTLRNVIRRWQHHQLAAVFHNMRARARQLKRQRYVVTVAIGRINNKLIGKAFLGWRENAKAQHRGMTAAPAQPRPSCFAVSFIDLFWNRHFCAELVHRLRLSDVWERSVQPLYQSYSPPRKSQDSAVLLALACSRACEYNPEKRCRGNR